MTHKVRRENWKSNDDRVGRRNLRHRVLVVSLACSLLMGSVCAAGGPVNKETTAWRRDERTTVYFGERRARYASVTKADNGRLLILFTHQSEDQEKAGTGDLFMVRRTSGGDFWFYPETVFQGKQGEPRAYGTVTTLKSGRIIAPFTEVSDQSASCTVRILSSDDDGQTWQVGEAINIRPLVWAAPYGRPFEQNGQLVMPVFGAMSQNDLQATRLCSGLLRSSDGGQTWGQWSLIAGGDADASASYEFPAVTPLRDGTLLAIPTQRQLKPRPQLAVDIPMSLVRCYSSDGGKSWTKPEQLMVGSWASLTRMDDQTLACSVAIWAGWGSIEVLFSDDGFRSIRQRLPYVEFNWLPNLPPITGGGWGRGWSRMPLPLPPAVPFLKGDWNVGHYGFSAGWALNENELLLVNGQRQRGTSYTDPPHEVGAVPIENEKVQTVTVKRVSYGTESYVGRLEPTGQPQGNWYLAGKMTLDEWRKQFGTPLSDDVAIVLDSGRWLRVGSKMTSEYYQGKQRIIGREKGYWVWKTLDGLSYDTAMNCAYSDDQGKTWHQSKIEQPVPLAGAVHRGGMVFVDADGTLVSPYYGYMNKKDQSVSLYASGVARSHDQGETWGDWSIIGYDEENREAAYSEAQVIPLDDDTWVAFLRTEYRNYVPQVAATYSRSISKDRGITWTRPMPCAAPGVTARVVLPDGGIAQSGQNTCAFGLGITYDRGRTFKYFLPATYFNGSAGVIDDNSFWMADFDGKIVSIYKRK